MPTHLVTYREKRDGRARAAAAPRLTHPERLLFEQPKITKQQLAGFYAEVAERMLRGIRRRPLSLLRCPDGTSGACFFQRHPSPGFSTAVHTAPVSNQRFGMKEVLYIEDAEGLLSLVQMNVIEIHAWGSTIDDLEHPDQIVLDLDPGEGVAWKRIVAAARLLRQRLRDVDLESLVRTSGSKGLHVVIPLKPRADWDAAKDFAEAIARSLAAEYPDEFVAVSGERNRKGRIFIDYLRNGRSASSVACYSVRARPGAGVATPLAWEELGRLRSADQYGVGNLRQRLRRQRDDPWADFLKLRQRLPEPRGP
jgi:bifunctional non-homologous end joining protein LigD